MSIRVALHARRRLLGESLAAFLTEHADVDVVALAATRTELIRACGALAPDVVVLEIDGRLADALATVTRLRRSHGPVRIVGLHDHLGAAHAARARRGGVDALVAHAAGAPALVDAITRPVRLFDALLHDGAALAPTPVVPRLTRRETDVLQLLAEGATTAEIATCLGISVRTTENYKRRVFEKLDVHSRTQAVAHFARAGLLRLDRRVTAVSA